MTTAVSKGRRLAHTAAVLLLLLGLTPRLARAAWRNTRVMEFSRQVAKVEAVSKGNFWHWLLFDPGAVPTLQAVNGRAQVESEVLNWLSHTLSEPNYLQRGLLLARGEVASANALGVAVGESRSQRAYTAFLAGMAAYLSGNEAAAVRHWQTDPALGDYFMLQGRHTAEVTPAAPEAAASLALAVAVLPNSCEALYRLTTQLASMHEYERALSVSDPAGLALNCPDSFYLGETYYQRGRILAELGQETQAVENLRWAVQLEPQNEKRLTLLGNLLARSEAHYAEAAAIYKSVVAQAPNDMWALLGLCNLELRQGHLSEAQTWCDQAAAAHPASGYPPFYQALIALEGGDSQAAVILLERAASLESEDATIWLRLGDGYVKLGQTAAAREAYSRALALEPDNKETQERLANLSADS